MPILVLGFKDSHRCNGAASHAHERHLGRRAMRMDLMQGRVYSSNAQDSQEWSHETNCRYCVEFDLISARVLSCNFLRWVSRIGVNPVILGLSVATGLHSDCSVGAPTKMRVNIARPEPVRNPTAFFKRCFSNGAFQSRESMEGSRFQSEDSKMSRKQCEGHVLLLSRSDVCILSWSHTGWYLIILSSTVGTHAYFPDS